MNSIVLQWLSFSVNLDIIRSYLKTNLSSNFDGLIASAESLLVIFKDTISQDDTDKVNNYWSTATAQMFQPTLGQVIQQRIQDAQIFGQKLILQIEIDNVEAGLTTAQIASMLTDYATLIAMLNSGSIPTALAAAQVLQPLDGMTQTRINGYITQIKTYLGVS